jgi:tetratricopeptide (TPR) repeat protein
MRKALLLAAVVLLLSSAGAFISEGSFSSSAHAGGDWKKAYLKGEELLRKDKWEEAVARFDEALRGKGDDDSGVRLYGMKFGYFPHRGKGIALYHLDRWEEARRELKTSIGQAKSDEAVKYLDLVEEASSRSPSASPDRGGDWKDLYLEGLEQMEDGRWREAIARFAETLRRRDRDDSSVKLYGMLHGYFPHREKGIAHYRLNEWEAAVAELETSLSQAATDRARKHLDLARERRITVETDSVFKGNWWNHYERGGLLAGEGAWEQAIEDYRQAIAGRDKTADDAGSWTVRTYGMRFIDYFPHRELGIAHFNTGNFREAVAELETSLAITYTAKAAFFLNEARKGLSRSSATDRTPPKISITAPRRDEVTSLFAVEVAGTATDDGYVSALWVNGRLLFLELAERKVSFTRRVKLASGENRITVTAADLAGNKSTSTLTLQVDREGPLIILDEYADGETVDTADVTLAGLLVDDSDVEELEINDVKVPLKKALEPEFSRKLRLQEGGNDIRIKARDAVGNTTEDVINLIFDPATSKKGSQKTELPLPWRHAKSVAPAGLPLFPEPPRLTPGEWYASARHPLYAARRGGTRPPVLKLKGLKDETTVTLEKYLIEGKAIALGKNQVDLILINDEPLDTKPGKSLIFSHLVELEKGENSFSIVIIDTAGGETVQEVRITREVPAVHQLSARMAIAVIPFESKGTVDGHIPIYERVIAAFTEQGRFKVVARKDEAFEAALEELKLSGTDLIDDSTAIKIGKIIAAEAVMMGTAVITENHIEVVARLVNTETTEILVSKDVYDQYGEGSLFEKVIFLMEGLAWKFEQEFPLVEGEIVKVDGDNVFVDLGTESRLRKGMTLIIFREGETLKTSRGEIATIEQLGEAKVEEVYENYCTGKIQLETGAKGEIKLADRAITK